MFFNLNGVRRCIVVAQRAPLPLVHSLLSSRSHVVAVRMSTKTRTSGLEDEPGYTMDETELTAYRLSGGPVDTSNNPILYYGKRGALAGHVDMLDKYIKRVPKLNLIMSLDAVIEKGRTVYATDQAVFAAEAERELRAFAPSSAIEYSSDSPAPPANRRAQRVDTALASLRARTPSAAAATIPKTTDNRTMGPNEWNRYGVNDHTVKAMRMEAFNTILLLIGRPDKRDVLRTKFEDTERPAIELRQYLIDEAARATATEKALVHNEYSDFIGEGLTYPITSSGFEEYLKTIDLLRRRLPSTDPSSVGQVNEDRLLAERIFAKILADPEQHDRAVIARRHEDTAGDLDRTIDQIRFLFIEAEAKDRLVNSESKKYKKLPHMAMSAETETTAHEEETPASAVSKQLAEIQALIAELKTDPNKGRGGRGKGGGRGGGRGGRGGDGRGAGRGRGAGTPAPAPAPATATAPAGTAGTDKTKVNIPRDENRRIIKFVEGMPLCGCGQAQHKDGKSAPGAHLYRQCLHGGEPPKTSQESAVLEQFDGLNFCDPAVREMVYSYMSQEETLALECCETHNDESARAHDTPAPATHEVDIAYKLTTDDDTDGHQKSVFTFSDDILAKWISAGASVNYYVIGTEGYVGIYHGPWALVEPFVLKHPPADVAGLSLPPSRRFDSEIQALDFVVLSGGERYFDDYEVGAKPTIVDPQCTWPTVVNPVARGSRAQSTSSSSDVVPVGLPADALETELLSMRNQLETLKEQRDEQEEEMAAQHCELNHAWSEQVATAAREAAENARQECLEAMNKARERAELAESRMLEMAKTKQTETARQENTGLRRRRGDQSPRGPALSETQDRP